MTAKGDPVHQVANNRSNDIVSRLLQSPTFPIGCTLAYLIPRLLLILLVPVEPVSDFQWYFNRGHDLASTGAYQAYGHPTAFWPVGYPAFLGLLFSVTGTSVMAAQLANVAFGAICMWLTYLIARTMFGNELVARLAILALSVYPNNIAYSALVATESLYTALMLAICYLLLRTPSVPRTLANGLIIGCATLVKSQTALLAAILVVCSLWWAPTSAERHRRLLSAVCAGLLGLAVVAPWTARNYMAFGVPIFVSTNGGISLLMGNNPSMKGKWSNDFAPDDPLVREARFSSVDQVAADQRARALAYDWITSNPTEFLALMPQKAFRLWGPDGEAEWSFQASTPGYNMHKAWFRGARFINQGFYLIVLGLTALAFIWLVRVRAPGPLFIGYVVAAYFTVLSMVFSGQSRYHFPLMPFAMVYAAWWIRSAVSGAVTIPLPIGRRIRDHRN